MEVEGRLGDEMYLTQFCYEEAKHVQVFRRWMDTVGLTSDLHPFVAENPYYRKLFYEELPHSLRVLDRDPSPANQVRASVTYNHVIEGSLALTGYYAWQKVCTKFGILPGMQEIIRRIGSDERRHMAWGTFTCRRHVAADDSNWNVVLQRMEELLPLATGMIQWQNEQFDEQPYGLDNDEFISYAADRAQRRLGAIESARDVRSRRSISISLPRCSRNVSATRTLPRSPRYPLPTAPPRSERGSSQSSTPATSAINTRTATTPMTTVLVLPPLPLSSSVSAVRTGTGADSSAAPRASTRFSASTRRSSSSRSRARPPVRTSVSS